MICTADRHGTDDAYTNAGCRCDTARRAHLFARTRRELRLITVGPVKIDATGTARRLQALAAIGYGVEQIEPHVGIDRSYLGHLRRPVRPRVHRGTADVIAAAYAVLADTPGPSIKSRRHAARVGWLEPKWWDDDTIDDPTCTPPLVDRRHWSDLDPVAVERAVAGDPIPLTRVERITAVLQLHEDGASLRDIARRLHVPERTVLRDLAQHRQQVAS